MHMRKQGKKIAAYVLSATMACSVMPSPVWAGNSSKVQVDQNKVMVSGKHFTRIAYGATSYTGVYDGKYRSAKVTTEEGAQITYEQEDGTFTSEVPKFKDAGSYKVEFKISKEGEDDDFGTSRVTIKKRSITVKAKDLEKTYSGEDPKLTYEVTSGELVDGETLDGITLTREAGENVKAGGYAIAVTGAENANPNYDITFEGGTFTVNPKEIGLVWEDTELPYDGTKKTPTAKPLGVKDGDDCTVIVEGGQTEAGDGYVATATGLAGEDSGNYTLPKDSKLLQTTFDVKKAEPTVTAPTAKKLTYNAKDQELVNPGTTTDGTLEYSLDGENWTTEVPTAKNAGTYTVYYRVVGNDNLNSTTPSTVVVNVAKKAATVTPKNVKKDTGKSDPKLTYTVSGLEGNDVLTGITLVRKPGEKVGTYAITAYQKEGSNPNYSITFKQGTFTINQGDQSKLTGGEISKLDLPLLLAKGKGGDKKVNLTWLKYSGATGYDVLWCHCDSTLNFKKFANVTKGSLKATHKNLKNTREYKYLVVAYKMVDGKKIYVAKSNQVHVAMKQAKTTNVSSLTINKSKVTLQKGKTFQVKVKATLENSKKNPLSHTAYIYRCYTSNKNIATVSANGVVTAKAKGTCKIYVLANNGVYKTLSVTVK